MLAGKRALVPPAQWDAIVKEVDAINGASTDLKDNDSSLVKELQDEWDAAAPK